MVARKFFFSFYTNHPYQPQVRAEILLNFIHPNEANEDKHTDEGIIYLPPFIYTIYHFVIFPQRKIFFPLQDAWQKINSEPVCFGARDNSYGIFKITKTGGVKTMKLVHKSGYLSCCSSCPSSFWGCQSYLYVKDGLMTLITDTNRNILLPSKDHLIISHSGYAKHSYQFPGTHHKSPELVFHNPSSPLTLSRNQELWIWYGQDYAGYSESNNVGKTCADVYALYV